jgi:hypothetical protein
MWSLGIGVAKIPKEDVSEFLSTIGKLIVSWSIIENKLGDLFCATSGAHGQLNTPYHASIEAAYFAINSFEGRVAMNTSSIIRMHGTTKDLQDDWSTLADKIGRKWRMRSLVAHSGLFGNCEWKSGKQVFLSPAPNSWNAVKKTNHRFFKTDLEGFITDFSALSPEIEKFKASCFVAMRAAKWPPPKLDLHPPSRAKVVRTPSKPKPPPRPSRASRRKAALARKT